VFYQNDSYGKAGLDGTVLALSKLGLTPVALATVERNSVDVANAAKTITAVAPDAIIQVSAYKSCAAFIRAARKAGFGGTFFNVSFVGTQALADELGKDGAGVVVSQVVPSPYNPARPITREFVAAIKQAVARRKPTIPAWKVTWLRAYSPKDWSTRATDLPHAKAWCVDWSLWATIRWVALPCECRQPTTSPQLCRAFHADRDGRVRT